MAQYIFIKTRHSNSSQSTLKKLERVCDLLTPNSIKSISQNTIVQWPNSNNSYYAIQNSDGVQKVINNTLVVGHIENQNAVTPKSLINTNADGSYAVIQNTTDKTTFFCDQFGSRTLWYYLDEDKFIISTSQRAVVALKGCFKLNESAISWYLSSGCQGPFLSWDKDVVQVHPSLEYTFNTTKWNISVIEKRCMSLPDSGETNTSDYYDLYEEQLTQSVKSIIESYPKGDLLLPLSGGKDSRTLLGLSKSLELDDYLTLVNWGTPKPANTFDDKAAARQLSNYYKKSLIDIHLPSEITNFDKVLDTFVEHNEGRIDHFNAFTDAYESWFMFTKWGFKGVMRGDMSFPTGIYFNDSRIRTLAGLELFSDFSNSNYFNISKYSRLQEDTFTSRNKGESLTRWRDRICATIRLPNAASAYSHQISSYIENRSPMLSWSLFRSYAGLPDKSKGNKLHISNVWNKHDQSGIPSNASGSLLMMNNYFNNKDGYDYLVRKLQYILKKGTLDSAFIESVLHRLSYKEENIKSIKAEVLGSMKTLVLNNLSTIPESYLRSLYSKRKTISPTTLAYRSVLIDKIVSQYTSDANLNRNEI